MVSIFSSVGHTVSETLARAKTEVNGCGCVLRKLFHKPGQGLTWPEGYSLLSLGLCLGSFHEGGANVCLVHRVFSKGLKCLAMELLLFSHSVVSDSGIPRTAACQASLSFTILPEFVQTHVL